VQSARGARAQGACNCEEFIYQRGAGRLTRVIGVRSALSSRNGLAVMAIKTMRIAWAMLRENLNCSLTPLFYSLRSS
jgi:hypothetical protein